MQFRWLFVASWVLLLLFAGAIASFSVMSAVGSLGKGPDTLAPGYTLEHLAVVSPDAVDATRGRRITASAWALGYALLLGALVLVPYRRGERWAWWAVFVSMLVPQLLSLARVPALGMIQGANTSVTLLVIAMLALGLGAPRLFSKAPTEPPA